MTISMVRLLGLGEVRRGGGGGGREELYVWELGSSA